MVALGDGLLFAEDVQTVIKMSKALPGKLEDTQMNYS